MRGKWLLIAASAILIAAAAGAIVVWRQDRADRAAAAEPAPAPPPAPSGEVNLSGNIQARNVVWVEANVSGKIQEFFADTGQEVYEGQLLARILNESLESMRGDAQSSAASAQERTHQIEAAIVSGRLEASRARADASRARAEFDRHDKVYRRQKMLYGEGATARLTYERSEAEFNNAKAEFDSLDQIAKQAEERIGALLRDLETAKRSLDEKTRDLEGATEDVRNAEVRSPVTGVVVSRKGVVGDEVQGVAGTAELFGITPDISALDVVIEPVPPVLEKLTPEMPAVVILADVPEPLQATVRLIDGNQVFVAFTSPNPIVRPGQSAQVRLNLN